MNTRTQSNESKARTGNGGSAPTTEQLRSTAHDVIDSAADRAEEVEKKVRVEAARVAEKADMSKDEAKQQLDQAMDKIDSFIRERPVTAVGIAFGAGVVATLLLKR